MASRSLLAVLLLPSLACTVMSDEAPDLDEIEAVRPVDIDVGAVRPSSCGFQERAQIAVTNSSDRQLTVWALFGNTYQDPKESRVYTPEPHAISPSQLAPGESTTFGTGADMEEGDFLADVATARLLASNGDPSDPEPPVIDVTWSDRCEPGSATWLRVLPVAFDPGGLLRARQALADITPAVCPLAEVSGAVVENRTAAPLSAWAAWTVDPATLSDDAREFYGDQITVFAAPVEIAPGGQFRFEAEMPPGTDASEVAIMTNDPVTPGEQIGIAWLDTCATPSGE
jgi:hypothetical protein